MKSPVQVPEKVRNGAAKRIVETLLEQKESYNRIQSKTRTMDAEEDTERKISYIKRQVGVDTNIAEAIANYVNPEELPISDVKKSKAESLQGPTEDFMGIVFLDVARAASRSVGRIISKSQAPQGTGFMISSNLFITNNHVIPDEETANNFLVQFNYEEDRRANLVANSIYTLNPETFFYTCPEDDLDFTVIAIGKKQSGNDEIADIGFLPLVNSDDKHIKTIFVNSIQHPGGDPKKLVVRENRILARTGTTLIYGSDTLPGSSGSLVDQAEGLPENGNEGIRISSIAENLQNHQNFTASEKALVSDALNVKFRGPSKFNLPNNTSEKSDTILNNSKNTDMENTIKSTSKIQQTSGGILQFTVPLTISIQLGQPVQLQTDGQLADSEEAKAGSEAIRKFVPDPNYKNRKGYNINFLGRKISLPTLTDEQKEKAAKNNQAKAGDDPYELKYQHFSLVMNAERRLAFFTAVNIDGASVITIKRDTGEVTRGPEAIGNFGAENGAEGGREKWYDDDRIANSEISEDKIYKDNPKMKKFQRGHLVKRTDPSWGTELKAFKGQSDTFHFTNCSPQHEKFNPITSRWTGVENWITKTSNDDDIKVTVFSGPVFSSSDPRVDYLKIPKAFWKVIAW